MIQHREVSWWMWAACAALLIAELAGWRAGLASAIAVSALQLVYFRVLRGGFSSFPVQVRLAYLALLLLAAWPRARWLVWLPAVGTTAQVLFGYCLLARLLSLAPWNRDGPLTWQQVFRTLAAPPVKGNVLQGLPPLREEARERRLDA